MKKIIFLMILCVGQLYTEAQVPTQDPYPNIVAAATQINNYSFFVDSVSNVNEQLLAFAAANSNITPSASINLAGVTSGFHQLYAKVTTTNGVPSITNIGSFYMEGDNLYVNAPAPAVAINKYSFFVDSVSTVNEQPLAFANALTNTTAATPINLAGVTSGFHQLYAKVTATNGVPSITNIGSFYMDGDNFYVNAPAAATQINKYSFFVDSVSSVNEQPLVFANALSNTTAATPINLAGVTSGFHQLYAKVTATNGVPSITNIGNFYMDGDNFYANAPAPAVAINRYEFYIDSVSSTNSQPLAFAAALQNSSPATSIDLTGVQPGIHQLYARVFTTNNIPSIVNLGIFAMDQNFRYANVSTPAPALQNLEYYIDTDPGYGLATPINISGTNTTEVLTNISVNIPNNLTAGQHFFHIRSRQNPWSIDNAIPFGVDNIVPVTWLYIKAQLLHNSSLVQWATAVEANTKAYEVEWSTNGIQFAKIGTVQAAGNTSNTSTYNFTHDKPTSGLNYYRLKQVDLDGKYTYSAIVKVLVNVSGKPFSIYPNPAQDYVLIDFAARQKNIFLTVIDAQGKQVLQTTMVNQSPLKLSVNNLPSGKYYIQISDGVVNENGSFIKK